MRKRKDFVVLVLLVLVAGLMSTGCSDAKEAKKVKVPVYVGTIENNPFTTDLGYEIELKSFEINLKDLKFAVAGEVLTSARETGGNERHVNHIFAWLSHQIVGEAYAHAGHNSTGDITGELLGTQTFDWLKTEDKDKKLGDATLLEGDYTSGVFTLTGAQPTIRITGVATKESKKYRFIFEHQNDMTLDSRQVLGKDADKKIQEGKKSKITIDFLPRSNGGTGDSFMNKVDFAKLKAESPSTKPDYDVDLTAYPKESSTATYKTAYVGISEGVTEKHDYHAFTFYEEK